MDGCGAVPVAVCHPIDGGSHRIDHWPKPRAAPWFYGVLVGDITIAMLIAFLAPDPMRLLVPSQVLNGIIAAPLLIAVLFMSNDRKIVGVHTNGWLQNVAGVATVLIMLVPSVLLLFLH